MTLSFKTEINGNPNYFVEKIWKWLVDSGNIDFANTSVQYERAYESLYPCQYTEQDNIHYHKPKLHTIRRDEKDRWQPGKIIHAVINNRTPNRLQFANEFPCISTQKIKITWFEYSRGIVETRDHLYNPVEGKYAFIYIDGKNYPLHLNQDLFVNDGFNGIEDFFEYFNETFEGKIIHWTDTKY